MANFGLIFVTLALCIGINADEGFISRLGFNQDILMVTITAFVMTGLIAYRRLMLVVCVVLLTLAANVSAETAAEIGYDPDIALAALIVLVVIPIFPRERAAEPDRAQAAGDRVPGRRFLSGEWRTDRDR